MQQQRQEISPRFVLHMIIFAGCGTEMSCLSQLQSDWEAVSLELEQWVVCVRQLEDVLVLQTLLLVPPPKGSVGGSATQCSIKTLLEGGRGELQIKITKQCRMRTCTHINRYTYTRCLITALS